MEQIESKTTDNQISVKRTINYGERIFNANTLYHLETIETFCFSTPFHSIFPQFRQSVTSVRDSYWHARPTRSLARIIRTHTHIQKAQISSPLAVKKKNAPAIRNSSSASLHSTSLPLKMKEVAASNGVTHRLPVRNYSNAIKCSCHAARKKELRALAGYIGSRNVYNALKRPRTLPA